MVIAGQNSVGWWALQIPIVDEYTPILLFTADTTDKPLAPGSPLAWTDDVPVATAYDDVYYSRGDGLAESQYVYVQGIGWPQAYTGQSSVVLGELGFGTGLNFVATWQQWQATDPNNRPASWHYVAVEGHPLSGQDFAVVADKTIQHWPQLVPYYTALSACYPSLSQSNLPAASSKESGNMFSVAVTPNIRLSLVCQPVAQALANFPVGDVAAWYLDGFSPAKNPDMWIPAVLAQVGKHSAVGARLATFTVARHVRNGLTQAGFEWEKRPGYGYKRHCLVAVKSL